MDNFFRYMFQRRETVPATEPSGGVVSGGSFEAKIRRPHSPQSALTISAVYRAIELRAKTVGQFQMQYQKLNREGGNFVPDMGASLSGYASSGQRLNYLLQIAPNPIMTSTQLIQQMVINKLQLGNAFVYIERDYEGEIENLWLATCGGYDPVSGTYNLSYAGEEGVKNVPYVPKEDVIHIPNTFRDANGYMGIPTIRYALDTLAMIATQKQQSLETAAKGGRVKLIIGEDRQGSVSPIAMGLYDPKQTKNYAAEINREIYEQDVVALRALDKVQNISMSAQDQQLVEILNMSLDDVARFFGTPRPLLMMDSNSHYTTPTNATLEYMTRTIQPDVLEIEQEFTRKLLNVYDFGRRRFHMCEQPLLRLDKETQAKVDKMRLEAGSATVNEIRKQYDMPSVEKGDTVYVSTNLAELGSKKLSDGTTGGPLPGGDGATGAPSPDGEGTVAE